MASDKLEQGFTRQTARFNVRAVAQFGEWLSSKSISLESVSSEMAETFRREQAADIRGMGMVYALLDKLREVGVCPTEAPKSRSFPVVEDFVQFLAQERGLCASTIEYYIPFVTLFLSERFSEGPAQPADLVAQDVIAFGLRHAKTWGVKRNGMMVSALRSFFRFLRMRGLTQNDLAGAVLSVPAWSLQGLPKGLDADQVEKLLSHCPRNTAVGRRDYAILQLLARLGLRRGEVANLCLEDIDWQAGELLICGKGRRLHRLPLPKEVGEAIACYLQDGRRPQPGVRRIFVRARPPYQELLSSPAVSDIVRRGLRRAGLPGRGAHMLRHGLATQMLGHGASLRQIGLLLRHQRIDTTAIYAKVSHKTLLELALPWPGGAQ
jgi:site-specific recombinase XerD